MDNTHSNKGSQEDSLPLYNFRHRNEQHFEAELASKNVFRGRDGIDKYLNPANLEDTPLVEMPEDLNPFLKEGISICAKIMSALPLMNIKSIPAYSMLKDACKHSVPKTLIESSSLNTVGSLGIIGRAFGIKDTVAVVDDTASQGTLSVLQLLGVRVIKHPTVEDPSSTDLVSRVEITRHLSKKLGWSNLDQYSNPSGPQSHYEITGPQIWRQTNGDLAAFVAGLGTAGTMCGTSLYLRQKSKVIRMVGVVRAPNTYVPGPRTRALLEEVKFDWQGAIDDIQEVTPLEAYSTSLAMIRRGFIVGPSSGLNLCGVIKYLTDLKEKDRLHELQLDGNQGTVVFLCCDSPYPHLENYFNILPPESFPNIEHSADYHCA